MSTAKGGVHSKAPAHQNSFAFKHNKGSKKTKRIQKITHTHLCFRCNEKIVWRKKFRKYKAKKAPSKCRICEQQNVALAYHVICNPCSNARKSCAKCLKLFSEVLQDGEEVKTKRRVRKTEEIEKVLSASNVRERERRNLLRKIDSGRVRIFQHLETLDYEILEMEKKDNEDESMSEAS